MSVFLVIQVVQSHRSVIQKIVITKKGKKSI